MKARRRHIAENDFDLPKSGWLVTFNDMMTLLLVFFVLLFSMGTIDGPMVKHFQKSLQSGLGVLNKGQMVAAENETTTSPAWTTAGPTKSPKDALAPGVSTKELAARIVERINQKEGLQRLDIGDQGQIRLNNNILFSFGEAQLNPDGLNVLRLLAEELQPVSHSIRVEGHTDNVPIRTAQYPSNWELSTARAVNVVKYLSGRGNLNPGRLSAAGYADAKPLRPNTSSENRAGNRRVELVLLKGKNQ